MAQKATSVTLSESGRQAAVAKSEQIGVPVARLEDMAIRALAAKVLSQDRIEEIRRSVAEGGNRLDGGAEGGIDQEDGEP